MHDIVLKGFEVFAVARLVWCIVSPRAAPVGVAALHSISYCQLAGCQPEAVLARLAGLGLTAVSCAMCAAI